MRFPVVLLLLSVLACVGSIVLPGFSDLLLLAGPMTLASLVLLLIAWRKRKLDARAYILLDGSNVMHWKDGTPQIETVREVVNHLISLGFAPGVVFDANAGYKLHGQYQHDGVLSRLLGIPADRVMVVPKGEPADPMILTVAADYNARVVTNDRFRDWAAQFPRVGEPGYLIPGGYRQGKLWLNLD